MHVLQRNYQKKIEHFDQTRCRITPLNICQKSVHYFFRVLVYPFIFTTSAKNHYKFGSYILKCIYFEQHVNELKYTCRLPSYDPERPPKQPMVTKFE